MSDPKEYMIDDEPVTWRELIDAAHQAGMEKTGFNSTSMAATFLRELGCAVDRNPDPH